LIVFIDESGLSERPTRVRTWAPKGHTPIIQSHFNWTHISVIASWSSFISRFVINVSDDRATDFVIGRGSTPSIPFRDSLFG
jgi:hypothetical protein